MVSSSDDDTTDNDDGSSTSQSEDDDSVSERNPKLVPTPADVDVMSECQARPDLCRRMSGRCPLRFYALFVL